MGDIIAWQGKMLLDCEPKSTKSHILFLTSTQHHYLKKVKAAIQNFAKTMHFILRSQKVLLFITLHNMLQ